MGNKTDKFANVVAAILYVILCVRFSASYFSYALGIFLLFLLYDGWTRCKSLSLHAPQRSMREWLLGLIILYGLCLVSSLLLGDKESIREAWNLASGTLPFFMLYFLQSRHSVDTGTKWGFILGSSALCLGAFFLHGSYTGPRMVSFFVHPNHFGTVLAMLLPFTALYFLRTRQLLVRLLLAVLGALMLYCLWRSESRGAMAALTTGIGLSFFVMAVVQRKMIDRKKLAVLAVSACLILAAGAGLLYEIQSSQSERNARGGERIEMLEASYKMWQDHKLLGVGLANWPKNYYSERYHPKTGIEPDLRMPHNMPVYFFSTAGLLGGAGYLAFLALSLATLYRAAGQTKDKWLAAATFTALLVFHLHGLVDSTIINKPVTRLFYALMGYSLAAMLARDEERSSK